MDSVEHDLGRIESAHIELGLLSDANVSLDKWVNDYREHVDFDTRYRGNILQMERMARLIVGFDRLGYKDFMNGQIIAFNVLEKAGDSNFDFSVYQALNDLYLLARQRAHSDLENQDYDIAKLNSRIGFIINTMLDDDICFAIVDNDEEDLFSNVLNDNGIADEDQYDALQGYRLVRMAETWYKRQKILERAELQRLIGRPALENAAAADTAFDDIVADVEFDIRPLDGLESCNDAITEILSRLDKHIDELPYKDIYDPAIIETVQAELLDKIGKDFFDLQSLKVLDSLTIFGNTAGMMYNDQDTLEYLMTMHDTLTLRGSIYDFDIRPVPSQDYVDAAINGDEKKMKESRKKGMDPYGLVIMIKDPTLMMPNGLLLDVTDNCTLFLPIHHKDLSIWRDPQAHINE